MAIQQLEQKLPLNGIVTFWTLADLTQRSVLKDAFEAAALDQFVPEPRPPAGALRDALEEVCGGSRTLIRPLQTRDGFAVVREERGDEYQGNSYDVSLTAKIDPETNAIRFHPRDDRAPKVVEAFNRNLGLLRQHQVSKALVDLLKELGGTTHLRPTGGIYWLPDTRLAEWQRAALAVERAAYQKPSAVYVIRHQLDADAIRAVRDAIVAEVSAEARRIQEEVTSGELGERALEHRRLEAEALRQKIGLYEGLLDTGLEGLRRAVEEADQAAAAAVLLASAQVLSGDVKAAS
jgi:hypothetical protein